MKRIRINILVVCIILFVAIGVAQYITTYKGRMLVITQTPQSSSNYDYELSNDQYFTIMDEGNNPIMHTGTIIGIGDQFLSSDNKMYEVIGIKELTASTKLVGIVDLLAGGSLEQYVAQTAKGGATTKSAVGIYHTHSDESYVPSDGASSIPGRGGVLKVGTALKEALSAKGIDAVQDLTPHDPHDAGAYDRSRRTALSLLSKRPAVIFDIHRDAAPPETYEKTVSGRKVTQVTMVLGKQNPKLESNLDFAKKLKAQSDKTHAGLVKGILITAGRFNQDIYDRSVLLEFGAHTNYREEAQKAAEFMSDAVKVAGMGTTPSSKVPTGGGTWRALFWVIILTVLGGGAYLVIATGGWNNALEKVRQFTSKEFANFMGLGGPKRRITNEEDAEGQPADESVDANTVKSTVDSTGTEDDINANESQDEDASLGRS